MPIPQERNITTAPPADFEPTVLDFEALITDINIETRTPQAEGARTSDWVIFDCAELNVIEAKEPYTLPVYKLDIRLADFPNTQWAVLKASIERAGYKGDINGLINRHVHFKWAPAILNLPKRVTDEATGMTTTVRGEFENRQGHCWQILSLEGVENTSNTLRDKVVEMAEGKTATEFKSAFLSDMTLQNLTSYQEIAGQVLQNTLLDLLVSTNLLTVDDEGKYHKVAS